MPVLGVTWVFGLLVINEDTVVFVWIFTVLNSLQVHKLRICSHILHEIWFTVVGIVYHDFLCFQK